MNNYFSKGALCCFFLAAFVFLQSCRGDSPKPEEIWGTWVATNGAELNLKQNGTFSAKELPGELFLGKGTSQRTIEGNGAWKIEKDQGSWQVTLEITEKRINEKDVTEIMHILISGSKGALENEPPWYLFVWKGEEGGDRYKFIKKSLPPM